MAKAFYRHARNYIYSPLADCVVSSVKSLQLFSNSIQWFSCEGSERDLSLFERNTELVRNRNEYRHDSTNFSNVKAGALVSDRQELKACSPSSCLFNPYHKRWLRSNRIALSLTLYSQQRQFSHCFIAFLPACLLLTSVAVSHIIVSSPARLTE
jgi:hypothetical protein